jgi:hypothetical protein
VSKRNNDNFSYERHNECSIFLKEKVEKFFFGFTQTSKTLLIKEHSHVTVPLRDLTG